MTYNFLIIFNNAKECRGSGYSIEECKEIMNCLRIKKSYFDDTVYIDGSNVCWYSFDKDPE